MCLYLSIYLFIYLFICFYLSIYLSILGHPPGCGYGASLGGRTLLVYSLCLKSNSTFYFILFAGGVCNHPPKPDATVG